MSELGIEVTSICSFDCYFCGIRKREKHILPTEIFKRIVDESLELGYSSIFLTPKNGDIFCDPDIYSKLQFLKKRKIPYSSFTNLHLVDPERFRKVTSPIGRIYYSEYGENDKEFEKLTRKPRSFRDRVLKNLNVLRKNIIVQKRNSEYILNAKRRQPPIDIKKNIFCAQAYKHHVSSNGDIILCSCGSYNPDLIVGSVLDSSLKDIFTSKLYRDKIKYLMENGMKSEICQKHCNNFSTIGSPIQVLRNLRL